MAEETVQPIYTDDKTTSEQGYNAGIEAAKSSATINDDDQKSNASDEYKTAYDDAKRGYLDGNTYKKGQITGDDSYTKAYNSNPIVQEANAGISAAKQTPVGSETSNKEDSTYKLSYENAFKGFVAGKNNDNVANFDIKDSDIYKKAFEIGQRITADEKSTQENDGITKGIEAAQADALDGTKTYSIDDRAQTSRLLPTNGIQIYKDAYQKAYDAVVLGTNNSNFDLDSKYEQAYNSGKSIRANQKTALVSNSKQLHDAIKSEDVTKIKAVKDISMCSSKASGTIKTFNNGNEQQFSKPLSIDGGGHTIDFAGSRYAQSIASDITLKNMVMYGTEYYGTVRTNAASNITYDNFRYYGPQLVESTNARITIKNKVEATSTKQQYKPSDIVTDAEDVKNLNSDLTVDLKTSE